jgi:hypothetical protein
VIKRSRLAPKYNEAIDRESAHEILTEKLERIAAEQMEDPQPGKTRRRNATQDSTFEAIMKSRVANTVVRELTRGILGVFGISSRRRR